MKQAYDVVVCCTTPGCATTTRYPIPSGWWVHRRPGLPAKYWCPTHGPQEAL